MGDSLFEKGEAGRDLNKIVPQVWQSGSSVAARIKRKQLARSVVGKMSKKVTSTTVYDAVGQVTVTTGNELTSDGTYGDIILRMVCASRDEKARGRCVCALDAMHFARFPGRRGLGGSLRSAAKQVTIPHADLSPADKWTKYTSRRTPWYPQEDRPPPPFLCTYMGRATNGRKPFRFLRNKSQATGHNVYLHNVYLLLYPTGPLKAALEREPGLYQKVFEGLQAMDTDAMKGDGWVYGGGGVQDGAGGLARVAADAFAPIIGSKGFATLSQESI